MAALKKIKFVEGIQECKIEALLCMTHLCALPSSDAYVPGHYTAAQSTSKWFSQVSVSSAS